MAGSNFLRRMTKVCSLLLVAVALAMPLAAQAQADRVTTHKDEKGWKLQVNGQDFYVRGIVWGYSPRGTNYTYNLWGESDDFIRKVLDYDFGLMKAAGVNAIRSFSQIPPQWVTYIYRQHGIMTVINPLMGRYGYTIGGKWVPFTDYSDPLTRQTLKRDTLEIVQAYKDVPGVLMFAFGNESNYGLSWSSFEIENLPEGEQNVAKARYLYSLFNEVMAAGKAIAPNHPFTIVNGDIQYIDLIAELCPAMDLLGSNVYRGTSFTNLWSEVQKKLDRPVVFFEFGSDAFNARRLEEDQRAQALVLKEQWQEMYNKAAGNGEEGNSIGGFVFEWRDEWWKYLQIENLDKQDANASWSNQAYLFDWAQGKNNMNEEWFGIAALGLPNADGVYEARPRMAYDVLSEVFAMDPYKSGKDRINAMFTNMDVDRYELRGDVRQLKADSRENRRKLQFTGGDIRAEYAFQGTEEEIRINGEDATEFSDGQMLFLDFAFQPNEDLEGQFSLNILGNVAEKRPLEFSYGDRGLPLTIQTEQLIGENFEDRQVTLDDRERIEIYDFSATYRGELFDAEAFYHTPRFHWGYKGDFFGLVREATDISGIDVWDAKAPEGVEIRGKGALDGLTLLGGPEVYWGANPKVVVKYDFKLGKVGLSFIHSEDVARLGQGAAATQATERQSRQTTLYATMEPFEGVKVELGGIMSATEKVDDLYTRIDGIGNIYRDKIAFEDTLGLKAKLSFPVFGAETYLSAHHAGLVADGGDPIKTFGVSDPSRLPYSGLGNKREYEGGMIMHFGNVMLYPRLMYRDNLVGANPFVAPSITPDGTLNPGLSPRDRDNDPFAVLGNREARSAEMFLTWDPSGATPFYDWDNDWREDAKFAFNVGGNYTEYPTPTDAYLFFFEPSGINASFGRGLPAEEIWSVTSRLVFNPTQRSRFIARLVRGFEQSTGDPDGGARDFFEIHGKAVLGRRHIISGYFMKDSWGPYDFYRQFNITYPEQYRIDYSYLLGSAGKLGSRVDEERASKIGIRATFRTTDENSPDDEFLGGLNDHLFLVVAYFTYRF
jgi:beta-galactosidase